MWCNTIWNPDHLERIWQTGTDMYIQCTDMYVLLHTMYVHVYTMYTQICNCTDVYRRVCTIIKIPVRVMYIDRNLHVCMYMVQTCWYGFQSSLLFRQHPACKLLLDYCCMHHSSTVSGLLHRIPFKISISRQIPV
jgi:hypothetical protein